MDSSVGWSLLPELADLPVMVSSRLVLSLLATYVHNLDPVIFGISEKIALRWYGLSYVVGFVAAYYILIRLARKKLWVVGPEKVGDVVTYTALFGVFLGGRLGYVFFYMIPERGWGVIAEDPMIIFKVWEGGMASHGGILGIMVFTLFYAWRNKLSWPGLGDGIAIVAPLGVFFGRIANFINGELYGTTTAASNWWAVKFPKSLFERENAENLQLAIQQAATSSEEVGAITATLKQDNYEYFHVTGEAYEKILEIGRRDPEVLKALADHTPARHASQLYEGVLEGALIFAALYAVRVFLPRLAHGVISGCFFISYAIFRILVENVRQPDAEKIMGVTKGQFYSFFMIAVGIGFLIYAAKSKKGLSASRE